MRLAAAGDAVGPVNALTVSEYGHEGTKQGDIAPVAAWPGAGCVVGLTLLWAADRDLFAIARSTSLRNLATLAFAYNDVTDAGVAALAGWPLAGRLEHVSFEATRMTDVGAAALIDSPYLGRLKSLDVRHTAISPAGLAKLQWRFCGVSPGPER